MKGLGSWVAVVWGALPSLFGFRFRFWVFGCVPFSAHKDSRCHLRERTIIRAKAGAPTTNKAWEGDAHEPRAGAFAAGRRGEEAAAI